MARIKYDTVYFWQGGTLHGAWHEVCCPADEVETAYQMVRRTGYYAVRGNTSIGAPEGPPEGLAAFQRELRIGGAV